MAFYEVLNDSNEVVNTIAADEQFMAANHDNYRLVPAPDTSQIDGRAWRDAELARTDIIAQTPDWPDRDDWLAYRTTLRNWPSTDSFPATRPNDPDYVAPETGDGPPPP